MQINKAISLRIRELIKEKNLTQYKLAQITGLYHSTLTDILHCKYKTPNFKNLVLIIKAFEITMSDFFNSPLFDLEKIEIEEK